MAEVRDSSFTVVILTYNSRKTIAACLQSLVAQIAQNFYVVIVDDASDDDTVALALQFRTRLNIKVIVNGSHSISRGRNLGIASADTDWVAFLDSDDSAVEDWTQVIAATIAEKPLLAAISGARLPASSNRRAGAIATNDAFVRDRFGGGVIQFSTCNCAVNRAMLDSPIFDEDLRFGEDLELSKQVERKGMEWEYVPSMKIYLSSRSSFSGYFRQMKEYGEAKAAFSFVHRDYRLYDFLPSLILVATSGVSLKRRSLTALYAFALMNLGLSACALSDQRPDMVVGALTAPAWATKNLAWTVGLLTFAARMTRLPAYRSFWVRRRQLARPVVELRDRGPARR